MRATFLALSLVVASPALASSETTIAVHPLAVIGVEAAETEAFSTAFASQLAKLDLDLADGAAVRQFLAAHNGSCQGDEACLAQLAKATSASSTLWMTFAPYAPKLIVSAKLIRADGAVVRSVVGLEFDKSEKTPTDDDVRKAFQKTFETLRLTSPELVALVEEPKPPTPPTGPVEATATTTTEEHPHQRGTQSTIGLSLTAAGLGAAAIGAVFAMQAQTSWDTFESVYQGGSFARDQRPELLDLKERAQDRQTVALVLAVTGAALAGTGLALYLTDSPDEPKTALVFTGSGAALAGAF